MPIEPCGGLILRVNGERPNAAYVRGLQRPRKSVEQQAGPDATTPPIAMRGETREDHQRNRMPRHAFDDALWSVRMPRLSHNQRIKSDYSIIDRADIGQSGSRLLRLKRMTNQETIQLRPTAGEILDGMGTIELFDPRAARHDLGSKIDGSRNKRSNLACLRGGASSAATKASQLSTSSVKTRRSAKRSSASLNALSSTKSLTVLHETAAAACKVRLASLLRRRSSFSLLVPRTAM